jgi:hypothetical protein
VERAESASPSEPTLCRSRKEAAASRAWLLPRRQGEPVHAALHDERLREDSSMLNLIVRYIIVITKYIL